VNLPSGRILAVNAPLASAAGSTVGALVGSSKPGLAPGTGEHGPEGLGWSTLSEVPDPGRIRPGMMLVAGNRQAQAVVRLWQAGAGQLFGEPALPGQPGQKAAAAGPCRDAKSLSVACCPMPGGVAGTVELPRFRAH
jgi:hypothetical protein